MIFVSEAIWVPYGPSWPFTPNDQSTKNYWNSNRKSMIVASEAIWVPYEACWLFTPNDQSTSKLLKFQWKINDFCIWGHLGARRGLLAIYAKWSVNLKTIEIPMENQWFWYRRPCGCHTGPPGHLCRTTLWYAKSLSSGRRAPQKIIDFPLEI